jgi:hypothetical protein
LKINSKSAEVNPGVNLAKSDTILDFIFIFKIPQKPFINFTRSFSDGTPI